MPTDPDRWATIQTLFEDALERPPDERTAFLRVACGDDLDLYREVASLLATAPHPLLDGGAFDALGGTFDLGNLWRGAAPAPPAEPERIGPWRLTDRIGEGGMGTVYRAERADGAYRQTAALKLLKRGKDSEAVLRRFRAERQILARLEHPHVARLLDGSLTDDGRPYFAMEYVSGEPITAYCDRERLPVEARLRLFLQVCDAVAFAHRRLVVHRDLKPSNVLVADADAGGGEPQVKLLDFGIAKVLSEEADPADRPLTRTGVRVMTPEYAAPEQIAGEAVTTATDVYGLGVLLYELLTSRRPYRLPGRLLHEVARVICEEEPEKP
ncbi:MAG: serine/threonine-protein kinase, partial [Rhodothermales bacterium]|nr:serine/threonine-protein kinase [Rhodothermales bacterium]